MYIRIVQGNPQAGQADEVARRWKELLAPRLRDIPGFRQGYFSIDRATDRIAGVTFWDTEPGDAVDAAMRAFRDQVNDITTGPPVITNYDVVAEA